MSKNEKRMLDIFATLLLIGPSMIFSAWVLKSLWFWFVAPFGVRPIGMAWAYGMSVLVTMLTKSPGQSKDDDEHGAFYKLFQGLVFSAAGLFAGWVAHKIMGTI
jgi:hypothetical protein